MDIALCGGTHPAPLVFALRSALSVCTGLVGSAVQGLRRSLANVPVTTLQLPLEDNSHFRQVFQQCRSL